MNRERLASALRPLLPELTGFARWLTRPGGQEGDDLVQEVVERALRHAESIDDPERLRAWLFRTARNARIDALRASASRARLMVLEGGLDDLEEAELPPAFSTSSARVERIDVERALARLPEAAREVLLLADLWEFAYEDIASILDVPIGTVRSRLGRARARMAVLLVDHARPAEGHSA